MFIIDNFYLLSLEMLPYTYFLVTSNYIWKLFL